MYHHFFGLTENPFSLTPDPKYLLFAPSHKEALASIVYGVHERQGFILILGEVGTGKTTLVRHVLAQEEPTINMAFVFNTKVSFEELLHMILLDLEVPCQSYKRSGMVDTLNEYLLKEDAAGRRVVLIIDEAQHLSPEVLEDLRMLSNLETARRKLLQILLVGQPELGEKLGRPELRQLRQRIGVVAHLQPFTFQETCQYIAHRLQVAGHTGEELFTRRALHKLHRASGGIPRLINAICDKSLAVGYGEDTARISGRIVQEVLKDWTVFGAPTNASTNRGHQRPLTTVLLMFTVTITLLMLALGLLLLATSELGSALLHRFISRLSSLALFSQMG